jgi:hypothetical protein
VIYDNFFKNENENKKVQYYCIDRWKTEIHSYQPMGYEHRGFEVQSTSRLVYHFLLECPANFRKRHVRLLLDTGKTKKGPREELCYCTSSDKLRKKIHYTIISYHIDRPSLIYLNKKINSKSTLHTPFYYFLLN